MARPTHPVAARLPALAVVLLLACLPRAQAADDSACHRLSMEVFCSTSLPVVLVGDAFEATATVKNTGDMSLNNVVLAMRGNAGLQQVGQGGLVVRIERLAPGQTQTLKAQFSSAQVGRVSVDASAREDRGWAAAGCFCSVDVKGLPALQTEMVELDMQRQPGGMFSVGDTFLYELTVSDDGGTALTPDLQVVWTLPPELEFVSGAGSRGETVTGSGQRAESSAFVLAPGQSVRLEVQVRVKAVPERNLTQARAAVISASSGAELANESESTTLRSRAK